MKKFLFVSISILFLYSCKSHLGTYATPPDLTASGFDFLRKNKFKYGEAGCLGGSTGAGHYEISRDTIRFYFHDMAQNERGNYSVEKIGDSEQYEVEIEVRDSVTKEAVIFCDIALFENEKLLGGKSSDFDGKATLFSPYNGNPLIIETSYHGYINQDIELESVGKYRIKVNLVVERISLIQKQLREYNLIKWSKDSLIIGDIESGARHRPFLKVEKKKSH